MIFRFLYILIIGLIPISLMSQMEINGDIRYGNEWIDYDKTYYKMSVSTDGMCRVTYEELISAGMQEDEISGSELAIIHQGEPVRLYVSNSGQWQSGDFLLYDGRKNRSELDTYLYEGGKDWMLNEYYSLINDTSSYYLTLSSEDALRYSELENELSGTLPAPKNYFLERDTIIYNNRHTKPYFKSGNLSIYESHFVKAEGFANTSQRTTNIDFFPEAYTDVGVPPTLKLKLLTDYIDFGEDQQLQISINDRMVLDEESQSFELGVHEFTPTEEELNSNRLRTSVYGAIDRFDRYSVAWAELEYTRSIVTDGRFFEDVLTGERYYEFDDFNSEESAWVFSEEHMMRTEFNGSVHQLNVAPAISGRFTIIDNAAFRDVEIDGVVNFDSEDRFQGDDLLYITSASILQNVPSLHDYVEYRESEEGGSYSVEVVTVEEIYDEYGYGVARHPQSMKNFIAYCSENFDIDHVYLIGKGLQYNLIRTNEDFEQDGRNEFEVPSFGYPASDILLTSPVDELRPNIPIARLAYNTESEISTYLRKLKRQESNEYTGIVENDKWRNRLVHLNGGGADSWRSIQGWVERFEGVLNGSPYDPFIYEYIKSSSSPVQFTKLEEIFNAINEGANLMTFFGHASSETLSIDIDRENDYKNYDQMPIMLALGCSSGNLSILGESVGESYCKYDQGGYMGAFANSHFGFISQLGIIGETFYEKCFSNTEGETVGQVITETLSDVYQSNGGLRRAAEQMVFMGDPCLKIPVPLGPDPALSLSDISTSPERISLETDSVHFDFSVFNIGKKTMDSVDILVLHQLPDGNTRTVLSQKIEIPVFKKDISLSIPVDSSMVGFNYFNIDLNSSNSIEEWPLPQATVNNSLKNLGLEDGYEFYIASNEVKIVHPADYSIIPENEVQLTILGDNYVDTGSYVLFEIDTTTAFNSPFKVSKKLEFNGGQLRWIPSIELEENQVYYWRSSYESDISSAQPQWKEASFVFIEGQTGWNQSHYFQFLKNEFVDLKLEENRIFEPGSDIRSIQVTSRIKANNNGPLYTVNGQKYNQIRYWLPNFTGIYVIVHRPVSPGIKLFAPPGGAYGSVNPRNFDLRTFAFHTDSASSRIDLVNFLDTVVENGDNVSLLANQYITEDSYNIEDWASDSLVNNGKNIFNALESYGATKIRGLLERTDAPYVFLFKKNEKVYDEKIGENELASVKATANIERIADQGTLSGPVIGNVKEFDNLEFNYNQYQTEEDSMFLRLRDLSGINPDTTELLADSLNSFNTFDLSFLNAEAESLNPQLVTRLKDEINYSYPQLDYWRVFFSPLPDYGIEPTREFAEVKESLKQFETLNLKYNIVNTSPEPVTGLTYTVRITDDKNELIVDSVITVENEIQAYGVIQSEFVYEADINGNFFDLEIEVNRDRDIAEIRYDNNLIFKRFNLVKDRFNPDLNVYFDDKKIYNREIVSPNSIIEIVLSDPEEIKVLSDTGLIDFTLYDPSGDIMDEYTYESSAVEFEGAQESGQSAITRISGDFNQEGIHTLEVNGRDNSGNEAGDISYSIEFNIVQDNTISNLVSSPNPFSESTRFKYTLSGSEVPENYSIKVYNPSGVLVRTLDEGDLGPLCTGTGMTDSWNGLSEGGNKLPSGVYYYRFEIDESENIELGHYKTDSDKYFQDGWGKLVIISD